MKIQLYSFTLLISLLGAISSGCKSDQSTLSGTIKPDEGWKNIVYVIQPGHFNEIAANYLGSIVDSAFIAPDGKFSFPTLPLIDEEKLVLLVVQKKGARYANYLNDKNPGKSNYMPLVLSPNERIHITAKIKNFHTSFSTKDLSADNKAIASLSAIRLKAFEQLQSDLEADTGDEEYIIEREEARQLYIKPMRDFAESTNSFFAALTAIRWVSPTGDFERNPEFILGQCQKWGSKKPDHLFTKELCKTADKNQLPVMVGDIIPNFEMPMVSNKKTPLHNMLGDQLTILDIWASWCAPCRKENRLVLAPLYKTYNDKGLNIIGYALDSDDVPWKAAIEKDGAIWDHSSHLKGDESPFMDVLRISTIPANYILNANGKILAKNLHGEALAKFVSVRIK